MDRLLLADMLKWKKKSTRKPLLLDGARQVGKTYLIEEIFGKHFRQVHTLNFLTDQTFGDLFEDSLDPKQILERIEIRLNVRINFEKDLIFFDEVGECPKALTSLKFFAEKMPSVFLCASGSNIGLLQSFPVGKVESLRLFPLCFEEFLASQDNQRLLEKFREMDRSLYIHELLWKVLLDYYFVGGMPEAVTAWNRSNDLLLNRVESVTQVHSNLLSGYNNDFGKYGGAVNAQHIEAVFNDIPLQLSKNTDESTRRYVFKNVISGKNRYAQLRGPIDWLEKCGLVSKCYPLSAEPTHPLVPLRQNNLFKLFAFDVGILGHQLGMRYEDQQMQKASFKGYIAENFVQNEIRARVGYPTYSWEQGRSQIEFLHRVKAGEILPVEVKSGKRTKAKSLQSFKQRYKPARTLKLVGSAGGNRLAATDLTWPLYYTQFIAGL